MIFVLGHILFVIAVPLMVYANISYQRRIKASGLPGRFGWDGKPVWYEGKAFRLRTQLGILLILGFAFLFGAHFPGAKSTHPEWWLLGYSILAPVLHIAWLRRMYRWSLEQ